MNPLKVNFFSKSNWEWIDLNVKELKSIRSHNLFWAVRDYFWHILKWTYTYRGAEIFHGLYCSKVPSTVPGVSLHGSRVSLHGSRVSLHGSRVSLHGSRVSLQGLRMSLQAYKFLCRLIIYQLWFTMRYSVYMYCCLNLPVPAPPPPPPPINKIYIII
jgi:hypothetical protein